jgi:lysophospholipase L1-like esterase
MAAMRRDPKSQKSKRAALLGAALFMAGMNIAIADDRPLIPLQRSQAAAIERHDRIKAQFPAAADIVLLGDSMIQRWPAPDIAAALPGQRVLNLGVGGDRTQNLLWRMRDLPLATIAPKAVIILVGTNNLTDGDRPADIAGAVRRIVISARDAWPKTKVYVSAILPRGKDFGFRTKARSALNRTLAVRAQRDGYRFVEANEAALTCPATAADNFRRDRLHLAPAGYVILGQTLADALNGYPPKSGPCQSD